MKLLAMLIGMAAAKTAIMFPSHPEVWNPTETEAEGVQVPTEVGNSTDTEGVPVTIVRDGDYVNDADMSMADLLEKYPLLHDSDWNYYDLVLGSALGLWQPYI